MSAGFFRRLAMRAQGSEPPLAPRLPGLFEAEPSAAVFGDEYDMVLTAVAAAPPGPAQPAPAITGFDGAAASAPPVATAAPQSSGSLAAPDPAGVRHGFRVPAAANPAALDLPGLTAPRRAAAAAEPAAAQAAQAAPSPAPAAATAPRISRQPGAARIRRAAAAAAPAAAVAPTAAAAPPAGLRAAAAADGPEQRLNAAPASALLDEPAPPPSDEAAAFAEVPAPVPVPSAVALAPRAGAPGTLPTADAAPAIEIAIGRVDVRFPPAVQEAPRAPARRIGPPPLTELLARPRGRGG